MRTYLEVLWRWRRLYAVVLPLSLVLGLALAFTLPPQYRARALLLPPMVEGTASLSAGEIADLRRSSPDPGPLEVIESPSGLAARLLHSRPVLECARRSLRPDAGWQPGEEVDALALLSRSVRAWITDELLIVIQAESAEPETAARLANAAGDGLAFWYVELNKQRAHEALERTEERISSLEEELGAVHDSLALVSARVEDAESGKSLLSDNGEEGRLARRLRALTDKLVALESEAAGLRLLETSPPPAIEFLERARAPGSAARPIKAAVVGLLLLSGFLSSTVAAFAGDLLRGGAPKGPIRPGSKDA